MEEMDEEVVAVHLVDMVVDPMDLIPWHVTTARVVAIWSVTVPALGQPHRRWIVVVQALPTEVRSNPGDQAQREVEESTFGWAG